MKSNNKQQLRELVRYIVKHTLNELVSFNSMSPEDQQQAMTTIAGPTQPPVDAISASELAKQKRDQDKQRKDTLKRTETELRTAKKEIEFEKDKLAQSKRFRVPALTRQIQALKSGT